MFKKMMLTALVTLAFAVNASAAMNKAQAELQVRSQYAKEVKATEKYLEEYRAKGDINKVSAETKKAFAEAIATIAGGKIALNATELQRLFVIKPDILVDIVRIEDGLNSNDAKVVAKAKAQRDMIAALGKKLALTDYETVDGQLVLKTEGKAAIKLLSLDLLTLPEKATEVVSTVTKLMSKTGGDKSITDAIKEGTKGIKGTLKDLIDCV